MEAAIRVGKIWRNMEAFGLVCMYGFTAFDDIKTKQVRLFEILAFGILGIAIELIYKHHSLMSILGGVGVGALMLVFSIASKEKIGKGDAFIVMVSGLYLGFVDTLSLLWISSVYSLFAGIIIIRKYDNSIDYELPFVPFLLAGYLTLYGAHMLGGIA